VVDKESISILVFILFFQYLYILSAMSSLFCRWCLYYHQFEISKEHFGVQISLIRNVRAYLINLSRFFHSIKVMYSPLSPIIIRNWKTSYIIFQSTFEPTNRIRHISSINWWLFKWPFFLIIIRFNKPNFCLPQN